ncbi:MAG: hypothetical protein HOV70_14310 [Streptomyces sp.]|nr:hypothetical protein [Streptomyces sp.]NUS25554.1 hypothetical protein [Streptomyces sp.]NUS77355.1 hypothetical protein [Streptomyces sp.]
MSTDEQAPASGSVPNAFGNALSWKWTRQMSAYLRRSGLPLLLCQLRNLAAASGEIAFASDRKPIRIQDIAKAACCDEKEARRYLEAAIRAGVVQVLGERKRGKATRYAIFVHPFPDWPAAEGYLRSTARKRAPGWDQPAESSGDSAPNQNGGQRPELTGGTAEEVRGTAPRWSSGDSAPTSSGDSAPNNPGGFPGSSHDGVEVSFKPQLVGAPQDHESPQEPDPNDHTTWRICPGCNRRIMPDPQRPDRTIHTRCEGHATTDHERHSA